MNKKRPLQIYLDSSDYSSFADGNHESSYKSLIKHVEKNNIEIRYSYITVSEFLQTEKKHQTYAIKRAEKINALSRSKVLINLSELMLMDSIHYIQNPVSIKNQRDYAFEENHRWFPSLADTLKDFKLETTVLLQEKLNRHLGSITDRNARANAKMKLKQVIKDGNLTDFGLTFTKGTENLFIEQLPISDPSRLTDIFYKFMKGEITLGDFSNTLGELCFNPVNLAAWTMDNMENSIENFQWMRNAGAGLKEK